MSVYYKVTSNVDEYVDYNIYEYDDSGLITFSQHQSGPREFCDFDNKLLEAETSVHRIVIEQLEENIEYKDLKEGSIFNISEIGDVISVSSSIPDPTDIYLHIDMTDGDGKDPLGIKNDGLDSINIIATFTRDPETVRYPL